MKKFLILFLAFTLIGSFAVAQDDGLGLTVGIELGFPNISDFEDFPLTVKPFIEYANSFGDIDLWAGLAFPLGLVGDAKAGGGDGDAIIGMEFELEVWYNLALSEASTLSFGLYADLPVHFAPELADKLSIFGLNLKPMVKFNQNMDDIGDLYIVVGADLGIIQQFAIDGGDDLIVNLPITLGWASTFGLGIEVTPTLWLAPDRGETLGGMELLFMYGPEDLPIYAELSVNFPAGFDFDLGLSLGLLFEYHLDPMCFYVGCDFDNIAADQGDVGISPYVGFKYSF